MKTAVKFKTYWIRLTPSVAKQLKAIAAEERMSRASFMAKCLQQIAAARSGK